jgi:hypothetical protein
MPFVHQAFLTAWRPCSDRARAGRRGFFPGGGDIPLARRGNEVLLGVGQSVGRRQDSICESSSRSPRSAISVAAVLKPEPRVDGQWGKFRAPGRSPRRAASNWPDIGQFHSENGTTLAAYLLPYRPPDRQSLSRSCSRTAIRFASGTQTTPGQTRFETDDRTTAGREPRDKLMNF